MKRLSIIAVLLWSTLAFGQKKIFKIDSLGYHVDKNAAVVEIPGQSAKQLCDKIVDFLTKNLPDSDVKTGESYISFKFFSDRIATFKSSFQRRTIGGYSTIEMEFKDGKIRVRSITPQLYVLQRNGIVKKVRSLLPTANLVSSPIPINSNKFLRAADIELHAAVVKQYDNLYKKPRFNIRGGKSGNSLYTKTLKPKGTMVRNKVGEQIEDYYNSLISKIVQSLKGSGDDSW